MARLTVPVLAAVAALAVALLPLAIRPGPWLGLAGAAAGGLCLAGVMLASLGTALAGVLLAEATCAAAAVLVPAGSAVGASFGMGAALLVVLVLAQHRSRAGGAPAAPAVLRADLAALARTLVLAGVAGGTALVAAGPLATSLAPFRPVLAIGGGLLAVVAATRAIAAPRHDTLDRPERDPPTPSPAAARPATASGA